ncbi:hypothetical protein C1645_717017 [Glomus cerebriforme]|uniref:Serine-threonine/tyrosine-protein kinase catalytic domain-containing protein n=1 Tax=Glomus cerebriforme TaxID=658196 RepID=A0A397SAX0_9GLOM|nr:hypothetical protein C1645_717151 [Glomus cerebriforme]RIA81467.1 hypothetical protein C1645_717017 [Glomus cerebriforme]
MWEMCTHQPPFNERPHDENLALDVCLGERPEIVEGTPQCLEKLMKKCWDANPSKRPTAEEIFTMLKSWYTDVSQMNPTIYYSDFKAADNWRKASLLDDQNMLPIKYHPNAYYYSRNLKFSTLPKAINDPTTVNR